MSIYSNVSDSLIEGASLLFDKKLRIAITGLSRGGKTALITSLVNHILSFGDRSLADSLPRFKAALNNTLLSGEILAPNDLEIPQFPYHAAIDALSANPPKWPEPTDGISKITLKIKYKSKSLLLGNIKTLYLDIWDYPGEWLMDLMLLDLEYEDFSRFYSKRLELIGKVIDPGPWLNEGRKLDFLSNNIDDHTLKATVTLFKEWLKKVKEYGFAMTLPGRFILPGALEGTPILEFLPYVWGDIGNITNKNSQLLKVLKLRYDGYREKIVKRFYKDCFSKIDRQIVLVDCLKALKGGKESFFDINECFDVLMKHFNYGQNNLVTRLFAPRIEKAIFVASKADFVTNDEHGNLLSLLNSMIKQSAIRIRAQGSIHESMVLSAVKATKCVDYHKENELYEVLVTPYEDDAPFYPGSVPPTWSKESMDFFKEHFKSIELRPPRLEFGNNIAQMNLDLLLNFLLGDKL